MKDLKNLQEENRKLQQQLQELNQKLEKSEGYKGYFISLITNEIINPFTSILGLSQGITQLNDDEIKKARELAQIIYSEAFFLDFQLSNIFMAARLEAGEAIANPAVVDLISVMENLIDEFKTESLNKHVDIRLIANELTNTDQFVTDPIIVKMVVANLISNAIKASKEGGSVVVDINIDNGVLKISVQDFGVGIEPKSLHELFERFKRVDETINSINTGSGIGLPVARGVLDLLHGDIAIESKPGEGSTFKVTIPEAVRTDCGFAADDDELFFDVDGEEESF